MKMFKFTTDEGVYFVYAKDKLEAEILFVQERFPEKLDDDLSDLYDVEEITDHKDHQILEDGRCVCEAKEGEIESEIL